MTEVVAAGDATSGMASAKKDLIRSAAVIGLVAETVLAARLAATVLAAAAVIVSAVAAAVLARGGGGGGAPRGGGMPAQVVGAGKGTVKFFNAHKGFGFIQREEGGEDVFVHISQVERAGLEGLAEGQELAFNLVDRGGKISAADLQIVGDVIAVEQRSAPEAPQRQSTGEKTTGTVKFFNSMKGFGFITRDDGEPDAFVHISAVERSGLSELNEGDKLEFELEVDRRGKYSAVNLVPVQG